MDNKTKISSTADLSNNVNIQNAFSELTNDNHFVENSLYWLNEYIEKDLDKDIKKNEDDLIIKIKKLLEISNDNINAAFIMLDTLVSK
jgi:hypothetical protein